MKKLLSFILTVTAVFSLTCSACTKSALPSDNGFNGSGTTEATSPSSPPPANTDSPTTPPSSDSEQTPPGQTPSEVTPPQEDSSGSNSSPSEDEPTNPEPTEPDQGEAPPEENPDENPDETEPQPDEPKVTNTATFFLDNEVYKIVEFSDANEIQMPEVPFRKHYGGEWQSVPQDGKDLKFIAVYKALPYYLTVLGRDGSEITKIEYTVETELAELKSKLPPVPEKEYYDVQWSDFAYLEENAFTRFEYVPKRYYVTFESVNGETVGIVGYTVETDAAEIKKAEPPVPELEGYENGRWEYDLNFTNITVRPVYDKIPDPPEPFTEGLVFSLNEQTNTYAVTAYVGTETSVKIPSVYEGLKVTAINPQAFQDGNLTEIELPPTLETIGKNAFTNCAYLKSLTVPDSVKTIESMAFANCTPLESVSIGKGVSAIAKNTFIKCSNLKSVILSSRETVIAQNAFVQCPNYSVIYAQ